jgi:ABC-type amino acid transport substrate-binding protein
MASASVEGSLHRRFVHEVNSFCAYLWNVLECHPSNRRQHFEVSNRGVTRMRLISLATSKARAFGWACSLLVLGCTTSTNAQTSALDRIRASGTVVLAHREASIPFSYLAEGKPVGYALDLCHQVAEALARQAGARSFRIDYKLVTPANRLDVIESGKADLECGSTTNTAKRRERVAFTIPHFVASARLMVLTSSGYERIEDLRGKVVASTTGTTNIDSVAQHARLKGVDVRVEQSRDHAEGVAWVGEGKVDAFAMDDVLLYSLRATASKPEALKIIGKSITIEPYAIAFQRNDEVLKRIVDTEMRRLIATGELHRLYAKWFQNPIPPKGVNLNMRMPYLLADSLHFPSDFVPN